MKNGPLEIPQALFNGDYGTTEGVPCSYGFISTSGVEDKSPAMRNRGHNGWIMSFLKTKKKKEI